MKKATIFDIQRFCTVNGPGIRTTIFLKGCPLHCKWCHNPESQNVHPQLVFFRNRCIFCGQCKEVCRYGVHEFNEPQHKLNFERCTVCGKCAEICKPQALKVLGKQVDTKSVVAIADQDKSYYKFSGGGVTFSGGEPLQQADFIAECCGLLRQRGIHTAVDTCGAVSRNAFLKVFQLCDMFLYDLKIVNEEKHKFYTGAGNRQVIENLEWLLDNNASIRIRIPLVHGVNDDDEDIKDFIVLLNRIGIEEVDLLPYHSYGNNKCCSVMPSNFEKIDESNMKKICEIMNDSGIKTHIS